jgi:putative oxidoreductase
MRSSRNPSAGLLLLRCAVGAIMIYHGAQKLFGAFGGGGIAGTTQFFTSLGLPFPEPAAWLVGAVELGGGVLLVVGLLTGLAAAVIALDMIAAIALVHARQGFGGAGGYEFTMLLTAVAVALAFTGPGRYSLDERPGMSDAEALARRKRGG